jgi:hypothetical protein
LSRVEDPEKSPVRATGAVKPSTPLGSHLATKAGEKVRESSQESSQESGQETRQESLRRPPGAQAVDELSALTRELDRSNAPFGITPRMAATMGFLAVVALLFVIMMPSFRQSDTASSFSADVQQFKAALSRQPQQQPPSVDTARPAIAEFQSLLGPSSEPVAPSSEPAAQADRDQSDELLRQFMQWRQKTNSGARAQ